MLLQSQRWRGRNFGAGGRVVCLGFGGNGAEVSGRGGGGDGVRGEEV